MTFPVKLEFEQDTYQGAGRLIRAEYSLNESGVGDLYVTYRVPLEQITDAELGSLAKIIQSALEDYAQEHSLTALRNGNWGLVPPATEEHAEDYEDDDEDLGFTLGDYMDYE